MTQRVLVTEFPFVPSHQVSAPEKDEADAYIGLVFKVYAYFDPGELDVPIKPVCGFYCVTLSDLCETLMKLDHETKLRLLPRWKSVVLEDRDSKELSLVLLRDSCCELIPDALC